MSCVSLTFEQWREHWTEKLCSADQPSISEEFKSKKQKNSQNRRRILWSKEDISNAAASRFV